MSTRERWAGRKLDLHGRPDLAELIRAIDGLRTADGRAGDPAAALRHLAPVGPVRPPHRGPGRLPVRVRAPAPAGPVGRRRRASPDGPPVHDRALPRAARRNPRRGARDLDLDRRHRRVLRRDRATSSKATLRLLETVRYDQVFAAAYSVRPGTPATKLADDVPPAEKRAASTSCSRSRSRSGSSAIAPGSGARSRCSSTR